MSDQERRALAFIALLITASAAVRLKALPQVDAEVAAELLDPAAHADSSRRVLAAKEAAATPLAPGERLDPNTATTTQLDRLPRVGPALAARIVASRESEGRFRTIQDLTRVPGIGESMARQLAPHLTLEAAGRARAVPSGPTARVPAAGANGAAPRPGADRRVRGGGAAARHPALQEGAPLNPNTASAEALEALPGVGEALAQRIVEDRRVNGPYRRRNDLLRVRGIGPKLLERMGSRIDLPP